MKFKKLNSNAILPTRGTKDSAGLDIHACIDNPVIVRSSSYATIDTGIACAIPQGFVGLIFPRSGLACKQGIKPRNCVGVIDADYRGEIKVCLYNDSNTDYVVKHGERVAQLVVQPFLAVDPIEVEELDDTSRGTGGFGSTGKF